ncbi:MAG: DUF2271 domain-containing protein [Clostridiales bacterium]|jgi:hypothetical protein|nr:DUF2271 domain-containing protein [Clostridiales bacterium]MDR2712964.1 DUF2271 domain-containing protein [Clostridiales bacterium]
MVKKQTLKFFTIVAVFILLAMLCACSGNEPSKPDALSAPTPETNNIEPEADNAAPDASGFVSGEMIITFAYQPQSGAWSNQFAVWIEDMDGQLVKTIYATAFTAKGGYNYRLDSLALWVEKSGLASMTKDEVDAITGATPNFKLFYEGPLPMAENLSYTWDLTDTNGNAVLSGEYKFFVEGTLRQKNSVLYSGDIAIGDAPVTVQADAQFTYKASRGQYPQKALTSDSVENSMISTVTAFFVPDMIE